MAERPYSQDGGHYPHGFERFLLVLYRKYPSFKEIPSTVSLTMMTRVREKARIHFSIASIIFFSTAFFVTAIQAKREVHEGKGLITKNINWHKEYERTGQIPDIYNPISK